MDIAALFDIFLQHRTVTTDSRNITKNCLFFALRGERFDGNTFAKQAIAAGAAFSIVDDKALIGEEKCIYVENVLQTLQLLAQHYRRTFHIPIIAITGSNGKTTTKELVATVLSSHYRTHYTRGNFNNHIGVPLTLLAMPSDVEVAVIEMGASHPQDIDLLCFIAEPTHGIVTNMGKAHLETMGGEEGVRRVKSELYRFLAARRGTIFVNEDEPHLQDWLPENAISIYYKRSEEPMLESPEYELRLDALAPFLMVSFLCENDETYTAQTHLIGEYNFANISTAVALGKYFKVPAEKIKYAIESYIPNNMRTQLVDFQDGKIVLDAYNANPSSVRNALLMFAKQNFEGMTRKIAILGAMLELGETSRQEHHEIQNLALSLGFDMVVTVGKEYTPLSNAITEGGKTLLLHFANSQDAKVWFSTLSHEKTAYLIKGSRGIKLEILLQ